MDLDLSHYISKTFELYKSPSQVARKVTESWASDNLYCPKCGLPLHQYKNNTEVFDFYCDHFDQKFMLIPSPAKDNFQLKGTKSFPYNHFPSSITGAEYHTTLASLEHGVFPSLILLHYELRQREIQDGLFIHRLSVTLNSISARAPLTESARRSNWTGTKILLNNIPEIGKIPIISESSIIPKEIVMEKWQSVERILQGNLDRRGWISAVMMVIDKLPELFSLNDIYAYQQYLEQQYPNNRHIRDKIRQQLQILREKGHLKFVGRGRYLKLNH